MSTGQAAPTVPGRRSLVAVWLAAAIVSVPLLAIARRLEGGRDDPDQAEQRIGFLDQEPLPMPAPRVAAGLPAAGQPTVVLFLRPDDAAGHCRDLGRSLSGSTALVGVLSGPAACPGIPGVLVDPEGRTAAAYGMRVPADGGPPVGYAVVDARARVRYRTLDPNPGAHSREIVTILDGL